jgi:hypothetical protein
MQCCSKKFLIEEFANEGAAHRNANMVIDLSRAFSKHLDMFLILYICGNMFYGI